MGVWYGQATIQRNSRKETHYRTLTSIIATAAVHHSSKLPQSILFLVIIGILLALHGLNLQLPSDLPL